jgi:K+-sensing histidine kinase KdpD
VTTNALIQIGLYLAVLLLLVKKEAERLNRLIRNLLDMTRLESGAVHVKKEWLPLEEVVGAALNRLDARLVGRDVKVDLPREISLVPLDAVLIEKVLINLLENSAKYSTGPIEISAQVVVLRFGLRFHCKASRPSFHCPRRH